MFRVKIVGAGQLGSRHLQALKGVRQPLDIQVIDPSEASLKVARERFDAVSSGQSHHISFNTSLDEGDATDIAIVATNSDVRRKALEGLFNVSRVKFLVVEKLLFNQPADYAVIERRLAATGAKAWVNCPMRVMPVYGEIKKNLAQTPIYYRVTGSQFGLVTNAIHYLDHLAHLSGCEEFELDTSGLDHMPIPSKRSGFIELNGTLTARFADGSRCEMTCYPSGNAPVVVEIFNQENRYLVRESEGKLWHAGENSEWRWSEQDAPIPYQSQITTEVVESLLKTGNCSLTPYQASAHIHMQLLDPLLEFVRARSPEIAGYPFT